MKLCPKCQKQFSDDANFCHAAVWEYKGATVEPARNEEPLVFENVKLATRSYK